MTDEESAESARMVKQGNQQTTKNDEKKKKEKEKEKKKTNCVQIPIRSNMFEMVPSTYCNNIHQ